MLSHTNIHTHTHTHTHIHVHAHTHKRTHTHTQTHTHTHTCSHTYTPPPPNPPPPHTHTHAHTRTRTLTHTYAHTHSLTHTLTRTDAHLHKPTQAHTLSPLHTIEDFPACTIAGSMHAPYTAALFCSIGELPCFVEYTPLLSCAGQWSDPVGARRLRAPSPRAPLAACVHHILFFSTFRGVQAIFGGLRDPPLYGSDMVQILNRRDEDPVGHRREESALLPPTGGSCNPLRGVP